MCPLKNIFSKYILLSLLVFTIIAQLDVKAQNVQESKKGPKPSPAKQLKIYGQHEFRKGVFEVTEDIHVAIGYALGNSILIEGDDGNIIVDVLGSPETAREVKKAFSEITDKPVEAIIYTHSHPDHTGGAVVFMNDDNPEIYAHQKVADMVTNPIQPILNVRAVRQFGITLPPEKFLNAGIGPWINIDFEGYVPPTKTFTDRLETEIAGVEIVLQYAPGETDDQLYVWLPEKKALLPGDNYYKTFPNLYTIRGSRYRDIRIWAESLDKMLSEGDIEYLIPSHTRPVTGKIKIKEALTSYRDAINYIYNETVEGINEGLTPVELSKQIQLPDHLRDQRALQEFYGTVPWSVRSVYSGLLGWFDGNATNLFPLSASERAKRIAKLAGGVEHISESAQKALKEGDAQWAAELADHLLALDDNDRSAKLLKADALTVLGEQQTSANGRNYYLTQAQQLREEIAN